MLGLAVQKRGDLGIIQVNFQLFSLGTTIQAGEEQQLALFAVVNALEVLAAADGPVHGIGLDAQLPLDLVQQIEGVLSLTVHLVDEGEDGDVTHGADLEQFPGLGLDALGTVDDHDGSVSGHQGTVGILGEVLVARGIQNVDAEAVILELHDGRGNGNTTLLLDLHPVGSSGTGILLALNDTGLCDGAAVEQEFFGQSGLTGVGVGDNGEGPAAADFFN